MENIKTICVVGLGYVGLPLVAAFSKFYEIVGYDNSTNRVAQLKDGIDKTGEITASELGRLRNVTFTSDINYVSACDVYIITVPTPVDDAQIPDLSCVISASKDVASVLNAGAIVIYESTVYPGVTEDVCVPLIQEVSGLVFNENFYVGYSPERINPSDKSKPLSQIVKVTSGSTPEVAKKIDQLYNQIIDAGTHLAPSIKVAEACKVIENVQRDVNIALMNELALILRGLDVDVYDVLEAAGTKWNFLKFTPGLVGGHCIGIDPYYLAHKAQSMGIYPEIISASRRRNEDMPLYLASRIMKEIGSRGLNRRILVAGFTFKENCPDVRNTKVRDLIVELTDWGCSVDVFDPVVDFSERKLFDDVNFCDSLCADNYDAVILAVNHDVFKVKNYVELVSACRSEGFIFDIKNALCGFECDRNVIRL